MASSPTPAWSERSRELAPLLARAGLGDRAAFCHALRAHQRASVRGRDRAQADRVLELWAAAGNNPPRSLGLVSASGATVVRRASLPAGTDHLAVSLEPPVGRLTS